MAVLLLFCIPLVLSAYIFQLEETEKHFLAFLLGVFVAALCIFAITSAFPRIAAAPDTLQRFMRHTFFLQTGIPLCITAAAALVLFRFKFLVVPSALFGFFTVKIYQQLFLMSAHMRILPIIFHIIMYVGALFIFDALLRLCTQMTFYYLVACTCCFVLFIGILAAGFFGLGLWYFRGNEIVYLSIFVGIALIGIGVHVAVYRRGAIG